MKYTTAVLVGFLSLLNGAYADTQRLGDWNVDVTEGEFTEAFTENDSGSTFGLFCSRSSCTFYLDTNTRCNAGATIPMLINSGSGSTYVTSTCIHISVERKIRYVSSIRDADVVTAISSGRLIGFAIPLEGGEFRVARFSLLGAREATQRAAAGAKTLPRVRDSVLRDRTM